ncbi:glutamate-1-semialdehyde 2,1-aminomutase [Hippea sp. KM1]|uniref:glutamate-1-semialdehyde 2,1-aminomutase n=1 Tax=Hippea sp. KM1 TaxID=944481 RepID=UPI00046CAE2E|nr:glutamate-1-semialdehyde 2,1-aminomutase [Hippea sp. KM1]
MFDKSRELFEEAKKYIAGGVNSPVRAFKNVGRHPLFINRAKGSKIYDEDGNEFIDYVNSWGPTILGHADDEVINKTKDALDRGFSFGAPTILETELAKRIVRAFDSIEVVRFVNSGTEAAMSAIRLARGFTGRDNILKFSGCYHGHSDSLLVGAGSGSSTFGIPSSKGVPADFAKHTLLAEFNDLDMVEDIFKRYGDSIAAIVIEPVAGNMGLIRPIEGFLEGLRSVCDKYGTLLIFDEVMTGFRLTYGGAQHIYNITPDITILGKVVGGGFPVACFGAKREIMEYLAPEGPVYQAGTLSGNPVAMACGIATLDILKRKNPYRDLDKNTSKLVSRILGLASQYGIPASGESIGSMFSIFFTEEKPVNYKGVQKSDLRLFTNYFIGLLERGIYIPPSQFESNFITIKHSLEDIENTLVALEEVFSEIASGKFYV